jgi:hypothetical protein
VLDERSERSEHAEWVRLERLCDTMQLLPDVQTRGAAIPTEAEFPAAAEFASGHDASRLAPPPRQLVEAAARKAYAERAWLASLPFAVERYFEVLAEEPQAIFRLEITVTLVDASRAPGLDILQGVVHVHDVDAEVALPRDGSITILSGAGSVSLPGYFPYTKQKLAPLLAPLGN